MSARFSHNHLFAVLTGDVVGYTRLEENDRKTIISALKNAFNYLDERLASPLDPSFQLFRGDSFQGLLQRPSEALHAALRIKSELIGSQPAGASGRFDVRIAIGVGTIEFVPGDHASEGDGEAYRNSGLLLDRLKGEERLAVKTPFEATDDEINTACSLLDAIIAKWTPAQAVTVYHLLQDKTQQEIADELGISQAAVHYRVKGTGWFAIEKLLERFEHLIQNTRE